MLIKTILKWTVLKNTFTYKATDKFIINTGRNLLS